MPSTFTWLDYSEHERRKMLDVIELFGEKTTRDELGLGSIRDAFADLLFPGTSTIQTRAKYFLFVPWIYQTLEEKRVATSKIANRARRSETELMLAIEKSDDTAGLIGRRAKENVQRLPSSVYWQGLLTWGIRRYKGSQSDYHKSLDLCYARRRSRQASRSEFEGESESDADLHNWDPHLPPTPDGFPEGATFALESSEAEYLREQVVTQCHGSLLAFLLRDRIETEAASFVWQLDVAFPETLEQRIWHGRNFSETVWGAQLLYNLMLAQLRDRQDWIDHYQDRLDEWWLMVMQRRSELANWDRRTFWRIVYMQNPRVSSRARSFVDSWIDLVAKAQSKSDVAGGREPRQLVDHRERQLKSGLARLHSERARELWPGAAGAEQLDLRWNSAHRICRDILAGMEVPANA